MTSADRTTVPILTSLRAIALPSGTGLWYVSWNSWYKIS
jgi:hypothetical protein